MQWTPSYNHQDHENELKNYQTNKMKECNQVKIVKEIQRKKNNCALKENSKPLFNGDFWFSEIETYQLSVKNLIRLRFVWRSNGVES